SKDGMIRFELSKRARQDLAETHAYIASTSGEVRADAVVREILKNVSLLMDFPGAGPRRDELGRGLRSLPVHSYLIFYRVRKGGVLVARVVHGARDLDAVFKGPRRRKRG